jgi:hypothetical protein
VTAETPGSPLAAALAELQTQLPLITKDQTAKVDTRTGGSYKYSYADLAQISRAVLPILGKLGLSFTSRPTLREDGKFVLAYELLHTSGESRGGEYPLPVGGSPQEIGGAITYARRYCLCAATGVAPEDDDNDAVLAERAAKRDARKQGTPKDGINSHQQLRMQQLFREVGLADRDEKLKYATEIVKRRLASATELTRSEADQVIEKLERWAAPEQPPAAGDA